MYPSAAAPIPPPLVEARGLSEVLLNVFGGCCGTDHRHVAEICRLVLPVPRPIPNPKG
ncbi:homocysteine S-methyltransferase family protein [Parathermosynechococcus lividus]